MIKHLLGAFTLLAVATIPLFAQDQHLIDSLQVVVKSVKGIENYDAWHTLVAQYVDVDNEKALELIKSAEQAAFATADSVLIARSQRLKGLILLKLGKPHDVIPLLMPFARRDNLQELGHEYLTVTNLIGLSHLLIGQFDKALEYLFLTNEGARKINDAEFLVVSTKNIGVVYYKLKDYRKALPFMIAAYEKEDSLKIHSFTSPMNISLCYSNLKEYKKAKLYLQRSILACGGDCPALALTHIRYASGSVYYGLKRYEEAQTDFLASLNFAQQVGDYRMQLDNIYLLAKISIERDNLDEAEAFLRTGDELIETRIPFNMETMKVYGELSELYLRLRNFERASFYQSRYIALRDSIYNEALMTNLMKIESGYLQRENEEKIALQGQMIQLKEQMLFRQKVLNVVIAAFSLTLLAFLIVLIKGYRAKKKLNLLLEQKVRERTDDLDAMVNRLTIVISEKEMQMDKAASTYIQSIKTVQTLCVIGMSEVTDRVGQMYLQKIREISTTKS